MATARRNVAADGTLERTWERIQQKVRRCRRQPQNDGMDRVGEERSEVEVRGRGPRRRERGRQGEGILTVDDGMLAFE